jgi:hypothetical protein
MLTTMQFKKIGHHFGHHLGRRGARLPVATLNRVRLVAEEPADLLTLTTLRALIQTRRVDVGVLHWRTDAVCQAEVSEERYRPGG